MQSQAEKTGTSHLPKTWAQGKMTDLKPTIPMLVSNVNIPRGHSVAAGTHRALRHVSLGFGSDLLTQLVNENKFASLWTSCTPALRWWGTHAPLGSQQTLTFMVFLHGDREPLPTLQREAPICPKHPIQGQKAKSLCWEGHRCQFSHQRWSSAFSLQGEGSFEHSIQLVSHAKASLLMAG